MALVVLLPLFAVGALLAIRRGAAARYAWSVPLALAALLAASSFVALRTGESEEGRVEEVVPERAIHQHEEAAERLLLLAGVVLLVAVGGLAGGTFGMAARLVSTAGSIVVLAAGVQVGRAGGELVYRHDAASVYAAPRPESALQVPTASDDD